MRDKIELLTHIDAPTRAEVMRWCREYEAKIADLTHRLKTNGTDELKRLREQAAVIKEKKMIYGVVSNVNARVNAQGHCSVFYDGRFKVLTQASRIENETSLLVGTYDANFVTEYLIEDLRCTLNDVQESGALYGKIA